MLIKKFLYIFPIFFILGCSTIKFGSKERVFLEDENKNYIREFDLSYNYKAVGFPVKGEKSIVEATFLHPENNTLFICISFPKIGILRTEDNGISFKTQFLKLSLLDEIYGYAEVENVNYKDENKMNQKNPTRFFYHFAYSPVNPDKIIITMGPYILVSKNNGIKWEEKNIFFDIENIKIRDVFVNENEEIIIVTNNKIAVTKNWGKKWDIYPIKIEDYSQLKTEYLTGYYDNSTDTLFASIKHDEEDDSFLSKKSYEYFYEDKKINLKSGLYYSNNKGINWIKSNIPVPVLLWKNNTKFYGSPIYPLGFYKEEFTDSFKKSTLCRQALLDDDVPQKYLDEYVKKLFELTAEDYQIISLKNNKLITFDSIKNDIIKIDESDFDNIYKGLSKLQYLDSIQWEDLWFKKKKTENFYYEYNFWMFFKRWTGMRTNCPVLYAKNGKDTYYRSIPDPTFIRTFLKYSISKQMELNSKKSFMKKPNDLEFFDPQLDPTNGFPSLIEYSNDKGKTWKILAESKHISQIIDPLNNKRSGLYWYKNVEQKKVFKLQISFGFDKGVNYLTYPLNLSCLEDDLLVRINYFSIANSYEDLYLVPNKF